MRKIQLLIWYFLHTVVVLALLLFILLFMVPFVNGLAIPDEYNATFRQDVPSIMVTRIVIYGLAIIEWLIFLSFLFFLNIEVLGKNYPKRFFKIAGIVGVSVLLFLAFFSV